MRVRIDDYNYVRSSQSVPPGMSKGRVPRDWNAQPYGRCRGARVFPEDWRIPRSEWKKHIDRQAAEKSSPLDIRKRAGFKSLNQNGTNYCWANAVVQGVKYQRAAAGMPFEDLSPASVAAKIKNYRNSGGWGGDALEFIAQHGVMSTTYWPANHWRTSEYDTPEGRADALTKKAEEFYELKSRDFEALASALLWGDPVAIGLNWWSHEVLAVRLRYEGSVFVVDIDNSWGDWGDDGIGELSEGRATPDDAVVVSSVTPHA